MGNYNFDQIIDRKNTNCIKYDFHVERNVPEDALPLWVADMDFETAPEIKQAMLERVEHGIFGYTNPKGDFRDILVEWMRKRHGWETRPEWYFYTPGVVFAISMAVQGLTKEGDAVLIQRPVYYPFSNAVSDNNRTLINNPLVYKKSQEGAGRYEMDVEDFETKIMEHQVKLFILCNPHNPVGRVWTKEELETIGDICLKHHVTVVADEIHEDFVYEGYTHIPFAGIKPEFADITVTCTSPSKTFNLAGLQMANLIVSNPELRHAVKAAIKKTGYDEPNILGFVACQAAYSKGEAWLTELKEYLAGNLGYIREFLRTRIPKVKLVEPEGTYLIWLDFSGTGLTEEEINERIRTVAKLWLDHGTMFGSEGEYFQRINIAAPRTTMEQAMEALGRAFV